MVYLQIEQLIEVFRSNYLQMEDQYAKFTSNEIGYEKFKTYRTIAELSFIDMVKNSSLEYEEFLSCTFYRLLEASVSTDCNRIEIDAFLYLPVIFQSKFMFLFWVISAFPPKKDIVPLLCFVADEWLHEIKWHKYWGLILYILEAITSQNIEAAYYTRLYSINKKILADLRYNKDDYFTMDLAYQISNIAYLVNTEDMKRLLADNIDHPIERLAEELKETLELMNRK